MEMDIIKAHIAAIFLSLSAELPALIGAVLDCVAMSPNPFSVASIGLNGAICSVPIGELSPPSKVSWVEKYCSDGDNIMIN